MADDDLEVLKRTFAVMDSDTYERELLPLVAEDFEMVTTSDLASEPDVYRGREGVRRWFATFLEAMDRVVVRADRFHDVSENLVIVEFRLIARGKASGIEAEQEAVSLATVRDGMVRRLEFFTEMAAARAAAGLPPS